MEIIQEKEKGKALNARLVCQRELHIEDATPGKAFTFKIDIVALKDKSQQKIHLGWKWLVAGLAVMLLSISIPLVFADLFAEPLVKYAVYLVGIISGVGCFYRAWKSTAVKHIFYSRNADVPVVELLVNKPTKKEFATFVGKLEGCILDVQQKLNLSLKNQLAGEMKMLRRLAEEGVLSSADYNKAKAVLLRMH